MEKITYDDLKGICKLIDATSEFIVKGEMSGQSLSLIAGMCVDYLVALERDKIEDFPAHLKNEYLCRIKYALSFSVEDEDLKFLAECSNEELLYLTNWLMFDQEVGKNGKRSKRSREELSDNEAFMYLYPNRLHDCLPLIENELLLFGSNVLSSKDTYRGVLTKVCDQLKVNYNPLISTPRLECELLKRVWDLPLDKLTMEDINQLCIDHTRTIKKSMDGIWSLATYRVIIPCVLIISFYRLTQQCNDEVYQKYLW